MGIFDFFKKKQKEVIKQKAKWNYEMFISNGFKNGPAKKTHANKHHIEDKCERCIELGSYCKNGQIRN
jgi:hypothetical protein